VLFRSIDYPRQLKMHAPRAAMTAKAGELLPIHTKKLTA
jgi:hypothetical protein